MSQRRLPAPAGPPRGCSEPARIEDAKDHAVTAAQAASMAWTRVILPLLARFGRSTPCISCFQDGPSAGFLNAGAFGSTARLPRNRHLTKNGDLRFQRVILHTTTAWGRCFHRDFSWPARANGRDARYAGQRRHLASSTAV